MGITEATGSLSISMISMKSCCNRKAPDVQVVELSPGANSIKKYEKIEGSSNRIFIFTTDNGKRLVAKIPFRHAGPARLAINSEVATMSLLKLKAKRIPIPSVLDWSDDASNCIGIEYIIMEHVSGVRLYDVWDTMANYMQMAFVGHFSEAMAWLRALEFTAYGSVYFADAPLAAPLKTAFGGKFIIGPHCGPRWHEQALHNQKPCLDIAMYYDTLIDAGLASIPPIDPPREETSRHHGTVEEHRRILEYGRVVLKKMGEDPRIASVATKILLHPNSDMRNIYVSEEDYTNITGIIDWQSSSIEPAFWYADQRPDFAIAKPAAEETFLPRAREERQSNTWPKFFDGCTQVQFPELAAPRQMVKDLFMPFYRCHKTWDEGSGGFRNDLIETSRRWEELGFSGTCPLPTPSTAELKRYERELEDFSPRRDLEQVLVETFYTPNRRNPPVPGLWEESQLLHRELLDIMMQGIREMKQTEEMPDEGWLSDLEELKQIWPLDIPADWSPPEV